MIDRAERHESRRIDRQLRGRCARQGDPGLSKCFVSLEDDLMRLFADAGPISRFLEIHGRGRRARAPCAQLVDRKCAEEGRARISPCANGSSNSTTSLNTRREVIYGLRNDAIHSETPREIVFEMIEEELEERLNELDEAKASDTEGMDRFLGWLNAYFPISLKPEEIEALDALAA